VLLNGVEVRGVGGEEDDLVAAPLDDLPGFSGFVEGGVVHDDQGAGLEFPQGLFLEVLVKDGGVQAPLKKGGAKSLAPLAVAAMRLVLGLLLPLRSPKTLRPLGAHA